MDADAGSCASDEVGFHVFGDDVHAVVKKAIEAFLAEYQLFSFIMGVNGLLIPPQSG